jgi:membrane-bound lytic murein transglycosylase A
MAAYCRVFCLFVLLLVGQSPAVRAAETEPIKFPDTQYEPVEWADVDGWANDDHAVAFSTFLASCRVLATTRQRSGRDAGPVGDALKDVCMRALAAIPLDDNGAKKFFEDNFAPLRINKLGDTSGFLTGYYEPIIEGSRVPTGEFTADRKSTRLNSSHEQ